MKYTAISAFIMLISSRVISTAQSINSPNDSLAFWSDVMFTAGRAENRQMAAFHTEDLMTRLLANHSLDKRSLHPNIVRLDIPGHRAEIITWQCEKELQTFEYYGFLTDSSGNTMKLNRETRNYARIRNDDFDESNWYGAVYYHVIPETFGSEGYCVLFGFAQNDQKEKFRIIELLDLSNGKIKFGLPVFKLKDDEGGEITARRQVIRYSSAANCVLRYQPEERMIMYDHIIVYDDPMNPGSGNLYPDGSYEALQFEHARWNYISKLKTESLKAAPREKPVFDQQKDLFGRPRKN